MNILSTEKNGYETLSNLLSPSFTYVLFDKPITFLTVEHAYQCDKAAQAGDYALANKIYKAKNGWDAKKLSSSIKPVSDWNKMKFDIIENMMDACFNQNPEHKQLLLSTGDEILTHKHLKLNLGEWSVKFPEILMKLRNKYQEEIK